MRKTVFKNCSIHITIVEEKEKRRGKDDNSWQRNLLRAARELLLKFLEIIRG